MSPTNNFAFSVPIVFPCLIALANSANIMLKSSGDSELLLHILDIHGNAMFPH